MSIWNSCFLYHSKELTYPLAVDDPGYANHESLSDARKRVEGYSNLVEAATGSTYTSEFVTLQHMRQLKNVGLFKITVLTIHPNGSSSVTTTTSPKWLLHTLEELECRIGGGKEAALDWIYFIVEDLHPAMVDLLGGFLQIPPRFFFDHIAGGGVTRVETAQTAWLYNVSFYFAVMQNGAEVRQC